MAFLEIVAWIVGVVLSEKCLSISSEFPLETDTGSLIESDCGEPWYLEATRQRRAAKLLIPQKRARLCRIAIHSSEGLLIHFDRIPILESYTHCDKYVAITSAAYPYTVRMCHFHTDSTPRYFYVSEGLALMYVSSFSEEEDSLAAGDTALSFAFEAADVRDLCNRADLCVESSVYLKTPLYPSLHVTSVPCRVNLRAPSGSAISLRLAEAANGTGRSDIGCLSFRGRGGGGGGTEIQQDTTYDFGEGSVAIFIPRKTTSEHLECSALLSVAVFPHSPTPPPDVQADRTQSQASDKISSPDLISASTRLAAIGSTLPSVVLQINGRSAPKTNSPQFSNSSGTRATAAATAKGGRTTGRPAGGAGAAIRKETSTGSRIKTSIVIVSLIMTILLFSDIGWTW